MSRIQKCFSVPWPLYFEIHFAGPVLLCNYRENPVFISIKLSRAFGYFNILELLSISKNYEIDTKLHPMTDFNVKNLYEPFKMYVRSEVGEGVCKMAAKNEKRECG